MFHFSFISLFLFIFYCRNNIYKKRGISAIPLIFGAGIGTPFLHQAGALVMVYTDGSVLLSHGGVELGQGLHTKMLQIASRVLEIPMERIYIAETATDKVPNTLATVASISSDLNGMAVLACINFFKVVHICIFKIFILHYCMSLISAMFYFNAKKILYFLFLYNLINLKLLFLNQEACQIIKDRLQPYKSKMADKSWNDWVFAAYMDRVSLSATGYFK